MRIVHIYNEFATYGGVQRIFCDRMNELVRLGYDVTLITFEQGDQEDNPAYVLSPAIRRIKLYHPFYLRFRRSVFSRAAFLARTKASLEAELTECLSQINPDVVCTNYDHCTLRAVLRSTPDACHILESHNYRWADLVGRPWYKRLFRRIEMRWYSRYVRLYDCVVALTHQDAAQWSEVQRVEVIPNMILPHPVEHHGGSRSVLSIGRLSYQKGYDLLLRAWKRVNRQHPDWQLNIYGEGSDGESLRRQITALGMADAVHVHHASSDVHRLYDTHDFYVMSSRYEGFGLVLIEAMQHGLPCVTFDCPCGPSEIVEDGINGYLVPNGDVAALATSICRMIENPDRRPMSAYAEQKARHYSPETIMPRWEQLFRDLM